MKTGSPLNRSLTLLFAAATCVASFAPALRSDDTTPAPVAAREVKAGANLAGADLAGFAATNADLEGIQAEGADLRGASFTGCDLDRAVLKNAKARGCSILASSLVGAVLEGVDFSGARIEDVDLVGASISGCNFAGARLSRLRFSPNRMYYTQALRTALEQTLGDKVSVPFTCGISGDAFSFVYDSGAPAYQASLPFTANPLTTAFDAIGTKTYYRANWILAAAMGRLDAVLVEKGIAIVPLHLETLPDIAIIGDGAFAGVVTKLIKEKRDVSYEVNCPPFGVRRFTHAELEGCWLYKTPDLEPAGPEPREIDATCAVLTIPVMPQPKAGKKGAPPPVPPTVQDRRKAAAASALRHAVALARDEHTYNNRWPGIMGLNVLAADFHTASNREDAPSVLRMAAWEGGPRQDVVGSRRQAASFLQEIAPLFDPLVAGDLIAASSLYASEAQILALKWPAIQPDAAKQPDLDAARAQCRRASALVLEVAALEKQATDTIDRAMQPEKPAPQK